MSDIFVPVKFAKRDEAGVPSPPAPPSPSRGCEILIHVQPPAPPSSPPPAPPSPPPQALAARGAGSKKNRKFPGWATEKRNGEYNEESQAPTPEPDTPCECGEIHPASELAQCDEHGCARSICPHCQVQCDNCRHFLCPHHMWNVKNHTYNHKCARCKDPWKA